MAAGTSDLRNACVPRSIMGRYVQDSLAVATARAAERGSFLEHVQREAIDLDLSGPLARLTLADGQVLRGSVVILATGLFAAVGALGLLEPAIASRRILRDPWDPAAVAALPPFGRVAIIGSGLTMVDAVVSLEQSGHRGSIEIISRHGLMAQPRRQASVGPDVLPYATADSLSTLLHLVRTACRRQVDAGGDWQSIVDPIRPHVARLWSSATDDVRRRFVRHLRPYWESHHHRSPPASGALVERLRREGRLSVSAASIAAVRPNTDGGIAIHLRRRGSVQPSVMQVDAVINSSGVEYDWTKVRHPLPRNLLHRGYVRSGPIGLGIDADPHGAVIGGDGQVSSRLFALGPPLRGLWWESTAIPDIVAQAHALAGRIAEGLAIKQPRHGLFVRARPALYDAVDDDALAHS